MYISVLAEYFSSVFTSGNTSNIPLSEGDPFPEISPIQINTDGVAQLLLNLKTHKATGPDNLPSYFLKEVANEIAPALSLIFQASLNQGALPDIWKTVLVVPILFKKVIRRTLEIIVQYHSPVSAQKSLNTSFTLVYLNI